MIAMDAALEFWLAERTPENRHRLVLQYAYLCDRGARKFYRPGLDRDDLRQIAAIGLLKACDRYDGRADTPFEAFAWLFVVGELMHFARDNERMVRAPRRLRGLERRLSAASEYLTGLHGREPSLQELASYVGIPQTEAQEVCVYREQAVVQSIDAMTARQTGQYVYHVESVEDALLLEEALALLSAIERTIIVAVYCKGYSQSEIAQRLGYSRRHISRMHRCALQKMQPVWVSGP